MKQPMTPAKSPPAAEAAGENLEDLDFSGEMAVTFLDEMAAAPTRCDTSLVGLLAGLDESGTPSVRLFGGQSIPARSVVPLRSADVGREVVLLFEEGNPTKPLIMGVLQSARREPVPTEIDGEKLVFTADREIVLRCGEASITLTRAGKVLIRGAYVLSRSSGVNRVKGGSVQIN